MSYKIIMTIDGEERNVSFFHTSYFLINPNDRMSISPSSNMGKKIISDYLLGKSKLSTFEYLQWKYSSMLGYNKKLPWNSIPNREMLTGGTFLLIVESTVDDDLFYLGLRDSEMHKGVIKFYRGKDGEETIFRRIEFWDAYIVDVSEYAGKKEDAMYLACIISPGIARYNKNTVVKKPWHVTDINKKYNTAKKEDRILVSEITGKREGNIGEQIKYSVEKYSTTEVSDTDRRRVRWVTEVGDTEKTLASRGEEIIIQIEPNWEGKDVIVRAYMDNPSEAVSIQTKVVRKRAFAFFIGGAGDKESFFIQPKTNIVEDDVRIPFEGELAKRFNETQLKNYKSYYLGYNELDLNKTIKNIGDKENAYIYIVGHSLGAWSGAHLAEMLSKKGYKVAALVTLDPVGGSFVTKFTDIYRFEPNPKVDYWINVYAKDELKTISGIVANMAGRWDVENKADISGTFPTEHLWAGILFQANWGGPTTAEDYMIRSISMVLGKNYSAKRKWA